MAALPKSHLSSSIPLLTDAEKINGISISEAIELTKFGFFNYFLIFISGMVFTMVLLETTTIGFVLPVMQCDLQMTNQDKGILSSIGYTGLIVGSHLWGFLADTKGRRKVIRPTVFAGAIATVFSSFSPNFWTMVVLRFINGFFVSCGSATTYAYLGEFHTDKTRSRAIMGALFIFSLGGFLVPTIAFLVINQDWILQLPFLGIDYKPWRLFMFVCCIPGFLCGLSLLILPESPKFLLTIGQQSEAIDVLQKMYRWNGGRDKLKISYILPEEDTMGSSSQLLTNSGRNSNFVIAFLQTMWNQTVPLFQKKYLRSTLIVCNMQFWLFVVINGMYTWFPHVINSMAQFMNEHPSEHKQICEIVYEKHRALYRTDGSMECISKLQNKTYFYTLILEILYASFFALMGLIINHVSKKTILFVATILFTLCGIVAVHIPDPSIAAYFYVLFFMVGVSINVLGAATVDLYPTRLRAMAGSISFMFGRVGSVVGANVVAVLLSHFCEIAFYFTCVPLLICAFLVLLLPHGIVDRRTKTAK